jgi:hypothetical protein
MAGSRTTRPGSRAVASVASVARQRGATGSCDSSQRTKKGAHPEQSFLRNGSDTQIARASVLCDADRFLRQVAGGTPKLCLNARLKAASDS